MTCTKNSTIIMLLNTKLCACEGGCVLIIVQRIVLVKNYEDGRRIEGDKNDVRRDKEENYGNCKFTGKQI